jgi:hypothetical protein
VAPYLVALWQVGLQLVGLPLVEVRCPALPGLGVIRVAVRRVPVWLVRGR